MLSQKRLFLRLTLYYFILAVIFTVLILVFPDIIKYLPVGGAEKMMSSVGSTSEFLSQIQEDRFKEGGIYSLPIYLFITIVGTVLLMLPISWVYIGTQRKKSVDQAVIQVIIILSHHGDGSCVNRSK